MDRGTVLQASVMPHTSALPELIGGGQSPFPRCGGRWEGGRKAMRSTAFIALTNDCTWFTVVTRQVMDRYTSAMRNHQERRAYMPLDPQAKQVLEQLAALGLPPNHLVSPALARLNMKSRPRAAGPEVAKVEDRLIPGPGVDIPVRIYTPTGSGPFPVLVWFHGGGRAGGEPG